MLLVVADTGPINYLVLIKQIELLPILFDRIVIPEAVRLELDDGDAPEEVRAWIQEPPPWIEVHPSPPFGDLGALENIHKGEKAAIVLAALLDANLLLMDDRRGVRVAQSKGFTVTGTLGILDRAADRGLIDFVSTVRQLEATNFRRPEALLERLLQKHDQR